METITWDRFKELDPDELSAGPCLNVIFDGWPAFVLVVRPQETMSDRVRALCSQIDASRGNPRLPEPQAEPDPAPEPEVTPYDGVGFNVVFNQGPPNPEEEPALVSE